MHPQVQNEGTVLIPPSVSNKEYNNPVDILHQIPETPWQILESKQLNEQLHALNDKLTKLNLEKSNTQSDALLGQISAFIIDGVNSITSNEKNLDININIESGTIEIKNKNQIQFLLKALVLADIKNLELNDEEKNENRIDVLLKQSIEDNADEDFKFKNKLPLGNKVTNLVLSTELVGDSFITETKLQENPVTLGDKLAEKLGIPEINFVQIISELKRSFDNKPETIVNL
ncbi:MAG: hypothetical protein MK033_03445 [Candidatus Caenarcaniphilales bacterium]|nr:hypothetical protein [Candidatus Caenarcaniphilales bacterium]